MEVVEQVNHHLIHIEGEGIKLSGGRGRLKENR
jgi:hypothetical protein